MGSDRIEKKNTTLIDVARYLGVSPSTVSRALNGSKEVSKTTIKRVNEAVLKLDYTPNEIARDLVNKTNKTIAAMIPDIINPYYTELIKNIEKVLSQNGFSLLLCITNESDEQIEYYAREMIKRRVSGILLLSTVIKNKLLFNSLKKSMVVVDVSSDAEGVDRICNENKKGIFEIVSYLLDIGHKDIAFIGYKLNDIESLTDRLEGYKMALNERGIEYRSEMVINSDSINNPGYNGALELLKLKCPPSAIQCMNEYIAMGAVIAINEIGLRIPEDISLTAHDDLEFSKIIRPKLTTVRMPVSSMGEAAAEMVLDGILNGQKKDKRTVLFESKLVIRDSAASPKE